MADLLLVRHAEATAAHDTRLPGPDVPLTERGRAQAIRLADRLAGLRPAAIYSSDARRARQTAEIVATRCGLTVVICAALRELSFGAWAGRTYAEVVADDPAAAAYFRDPEAMTPPGGEELAGVADRVLAAIARIMEQHPHDGAVVVGHAGSLRLALARALGMPLGAYWRLRLEPAGLSAGAWSEAGLIVETLNDRGHLAPSEPGDAP